jgi:predicted dehydrogenase
LTKPLTAVLCGAGNRGLDGYGTYALLRPELLKIVAAADPRETRRHLAQRRHQIADDLLFEDWAELSGRERIADVAIVATPDTGHVEPTIALMEHGYHVLLEKPMALSPQDCWRLVECAEQTGRILTVCHVLRYAPYFREMKSFLESGRLGQLVTLRHLEPVNFWRFTHSFVRGNWSREVDSSPFILSKACHDFDLLAYLVGLPCLRISSFGSLTHFRPENKPEGAAARCADCSLAEEKCPFSATRYYLDELRNGELDWPVNVVIEEYSEEALLEALRTGPYGRCVYECDNDVVDHQVVNLEFEGGVTASFTAAAFTDHRVRETEVMGSLGSLKGNGTSLEFYDFQSRKIERWEVPAEGRHLGGDAAMLESFFRAVRSGNRSLLDTGPRESVASHLMAFAAERSRLTGETQVLKDFPK